MSQTCSASFSTRFKVGENVKNGQGEFVAFTKSGREINREQYDRIYKIFHEYSLPNIVKNHEAERAIEIFGKRNELIERDLQALDQDLSAIFIPKTVYELVFIHACIEEDLTAPPQGPCEDL